MMTLKTPIALSLAGMLAMTACAPTGQTRIDDPNYRAQNGAMTVRLSLRTFSCSTA